MKEQKTKILIIEDDRFLSSILKTRLEKEGFEVLQAFDGNEGMEFLCGHLFYGPKQIVAIYE